MTAILAYCVSGQHFRFTRLSFVVFAIAFALEGCSPPDQRVLDLCRKSSTASALGRSLTVDDVGELTEECMSRRGYALLKTGPTCKDDLQSQQRRECYFPDTTVGHLFGANPR